MDSGRVVTHALALRTILAGDIAPVPRPGRRCGAAGVGIAAVGVATAAVTLSLRAPGPAGERARAALLTGLIILVPVGVGLYACRRAPQRPFGAMLIAAGFLWSTAALAQTDSSLAYSLGRLGGWTVTLLVVILVLAYPDGRLVARSQRWLAAATLSVFAVLYLPSALLVEDYPALSPWSTCDADCPTNAFMVLDHQPAFLDAWVIPLREALTVALVLGVLWTVVGRARHATPLRRRTLLPVLVAASVLMLALAAFVVARRTGAGAPAIDTLGWLYGLCIPGVAIGLLVGLARWRFYVAEALRSVSTLLHGRIAPDHLRDELASALEDPSLELAYPRDGGWVDDRGRPLAVPPPRSDRALTTIGGPDATVAALVHDTAWSDDAAFMEAVRACVLTLIERGSPHASPDFPLGDVEAARARLLSELDGERRRLERDLHDGAQQRLVGLRIRLGLALDPEAGGPETDATLLEQLGGEVDEIIDDIRSLARGIYPSLLVDRGLHDALASAALRMPVPTHVEAHGIARYGDAVEAAVYFTCLEALQNAAKHASGATAISIALRDDDGALRFEIRDDGAGFDPGTTARRGLGHMHDRTSGVGGTLTIESSPGSGTRIAGTVPLVERPSAPPERARAFATRPPLDDTAILRRRA